ncbi:semaphorin, partial [Elysia marginata]
IASSKEKVLSLSSGEDYFKLLLSEEDRVFIGAKNRVYNIRLHDLQTASILEWNANDVAVNKCRMNSKTDCANYVRVIARKDGNLMICGTNAYSPLCRQYKLTEDDEFEKLREDSPGTAICPFDAESNATALYTGGKLYTATRAQSNGGGPLILKSYQDRKIRTTDGDSTLLNEPDFVSSFEKDDKVYFFFREIAVENINCGKAVFSRVARVCKQDSGGYFESWKNTLTSFFKARLNCSIPGEFPFYFDEIQSTSEFGQGNYKPTTDSGDRHDLIYGVFNTPENAIRGSAVCAFRYSDIASTFRGQFKGQSSFESFWLPVPWADTPKEHPEKCTNESDKIPDDTARFSKDHPLMDEAVKPTGGMPMLVFTSFKARFTKIAIDWQILAADKHYYDVMFVGTDDGRVIKAINKGQGSKVESVIIEDLQVLEPGKPVTDLKVVSNRADHAGQKLVVVSRDSVVAIPLSRCKRAKTCRKCVALQDPYCAWNSALLQCMSAETGLQNIDTGKHPQCKPDPIEKKKKRKPPKDDKLVMAAKTSSNDGCVCPEDASSEYSDKWRRVDLADTPEDLLKQTC